MKISRIEIIYAAIPYTTGGPLYAKNAELGMKAEHKKTALMVRVETEDGMIGWGEGFSQGMTPGTMSVISEVIAPWFIGRDSRDITALFDAGERAFASAGRSGPVFFALSAIDTALWDIAAKRARLPLYRLLGGKAGPIDRYASLMRYGGNPELVARHVKRVRETGYKMVKLHETTIPAFVAAHEAAGPDMRVTLDIGSHWTLDEARRIARAIRQYEFYWIEEPVWPTEDFGAMAMLRREGVSIAAGENSASLYEFRRMFDMEAVDVVQPSLVKVGGVTGMMRIAALAKAYPVRVVPHAFYWGPGYLATAHVITTMSHRPPLETAFITMEAKPHPLFDPEDNAALTLPETPGLGFEPTDEVLKAYTLARREVH
jgi:L-alanine-DL-glutamate epimerase-like enolase superfamily enzyme